MMKEALVVSPTALAPWPGGGGSRTAAACKYLPCSGWRASLLTADFGPDIPEWARSTRCMRASWPRFWRRGTRASAWRTPQSNANPGALREKLWAVAQRGLGVVLFPDESVTWVPKAVRMARQQFGGRHPDVVLSMAPRFSAHLAAERLARLWHVPWVAEFQDPFVGNVFTAWPTPLHQAAAALLERRWIQDAAAVTTTTESLRRQMLARYPRLADKIAVIPNGYDPVDPDPVALDRNHLHIVHCGQLYGGRVPDHFLSAIADLGRRRPDLARRLRVHFVGPVSQRVETVARRLGLVETVQSEGVAPHARSMGWMRAADLLLLIKHVSPLAAPQVPTKLYEYLSTGKPILALAHESELAQILRRAGAGVIVPPSDVDAISRAVESLADGRGLGDSRRDESYVREFALPALMQQMAQVLDSAVSAAARSAPWLR